MPSVQVVRPPAPADVRAIQDLEGAARAHDGHESLAASIWRDLAAPTPDSTGIFVTSAGGILGYLHLAPSDTLADPHLVAGVVVDPAHRDRETVSALLDALAREMTQRGGGRVVLWVNGADAALDTAALANGFHVRSEQFQIRVPLPLPESPLWPPGITVRTFVPDRDDADWLRVNNRAFADHPDQGSWSEATLGMRTAERWFDPAGLLLAFAPAGDLAGFCWTKVHEATADDEQLGEIYVIGVDPDHQGTGLGRALTVGGLEHLARDRGCRTGMLYVDGANPAALGLYRALGFTEHRVDRAYELEVAAP